MGYIVDTPARKKTSSGNNMQLRWMSRLSGRGLVSKQYANLHAANAMHKKLRLNPINRDNKSLRNHYCANSLVYHAEVLVVCPFVTRVGLGTELTRRSIEAAKSYGCGHYVACATGRHSQRIFQKLGFSIGRTVDYKEEKDKFGNLVVWDHREHTHAETVVKTLL